MAMSGPDIDDGNTTLESESCSPLFFRKLFVEDSYKRKRYITNK